MKLSTSGLPGLSVLPITIFPSFPYVFQFHFRQLWKFLLQNTSAYTCQKARRFFFEAWTLTPSEPENGNRDNLSIPLKLDFSWGRGSARIFAVQYFKTPWWHRVIKEGMREFAWRTIRDHNFASSNKLDFFSGEGGGHEFSLFNIITSRDKSKRLCDNFILCLWEINECDN